MIKYCLSAGEFHSGKPHNAVSFSILRQILTDKGNSTTEILRFMKDKKMKESHKMGIYEE